MNGEKWRLIRSTHPQIDPGGVFELELGADRLRAVGLGGFITSPITLYYREGDHLKVITKNNTYVFERVG